MVTVPKGTISYVPSRDQSTIYEFSDKIPPRFDGQCDYRSYRDDVIMWMNLRTRPVLKHRPAIVAYLHGEEKSAASMLLAEAVCKEGGLDFILERLDKAYGVD